MYNKDNQGIVLSEFRKMPTIGELSERNLKIEVSGNFSGTGYVSVNMTSVGGISFGATMTNESAIIFYRNIEKLYEKTREVMREWEEENKNDKGEKK